MKNTSFSRRGPDYITEELVEALGQKIPLDFKGLFDVIFVKLATRNVAKGGQEMLRLRAYERLQNLVRQGVAKKVDGKYKGVALELAKMREQLRAEAVPNGPAATGENRPAKAESSVSSSKRSPGSTPSKTKKVTAAAR